VVNTWDALLAPYSVTISLVIDPTQANIMLDTSTPSACGGMVNGVLGCFIEPNAEIAMIQGRNWYVGADPMQIGPVGFRDDGAARTSHALGLEGGFDPSSPM
jgi:hypothetical protein